jgi:elongation factor Tu
MRADIKNMITGAAQMDGGIIVSLFLPSLVINMLMTLM